HAELLDKVVRDGGAPLPPRAASMLLAVSADSEGKGAEWLSGVLRKLTNSGHFDLVVGTLLRMTSQASTCDLVEVLGGEVRRQYWDRLQWVHDETPANLARAIFRLVEVGRPALALQAASFGIDHLSADVAL